MLFANRMECKLAAWDPVLLLLGSLDSLLDGHGVAGDDGLQSYQSSAVIKDGCFVLVADALDAVFLFLWWKEML